MAVAALPDAETKLHAITGACARAIASPVTGLITILLLTTLVYVPSLSAWFNTDDFRYLGTVPYSPVPTFMRQAFDFRHVSMPVPGFLGHYRPLYLIGWLINYRLFGLNATGYHAASLALHLSIVALTWWIARRITGRVVVAHLAALVMALHPSFTRSVIWAAAVTDMEVALATLGTLALFLLYVEGGLRSRWLYGGSLAMFAVALCFHPKAMPIVVALAGVYCLASDGGWRELVRPKALLIFSPFVAMAGAETLIQLYVRSHVAVLDALYGFGLFSVRDYLGYLAIAVFPGWRNIWDQELYGGPYYGGEINYAILALGAIVLAGLGSGVVLLARVRHRDAGITALAVVWFLATIAPLATFKGGVVDRDLYAAGPAWALIVGLAGSWVVDAVRVRPVFVRALAAAVLVVAVALASVRTIAYERDFRSDSHLIEAFTEQLRVTYPTLPPGTQLYVANAPFELRVAELMDYPIAAYYPGVKAHLTTTDGAKARQGHLATYERIFVFQTTEPCHPTRSPFVPAWFNLCLLF